MSQPLVYFSKNKLLDNVNPVPLSLLSGCRAGWHYEPRGDHFPGGVDGQVQGYRESGGAKAGGGGGHPTDAGRTGREKGGANHLHLQTGTFM